MSSSYVELGQNWPKTWNWVDPTDWKKPTLDYVPRELVYLDRFWIFINSAAFCAIEQGSSGAFIPGKPWLSEPRRPSSVTVSLGESNIDGLFPAIKGQGTPQKPRGTTGGT
jgi:hypothetical protein